MMTGKVVISGGGQHIAAAANSNSPLASCGRLVRCHREPSWCVRSACHARPKRSVRLSPRLAAAPVWDLSRAAASYTRQLDATCREVAARPEIDTDVTVDEDVDQGGAHRGDLGRASLI